MMIGFAGNLEKEGIAELRGQLMLEAEAQHAVCLALNSAQEIREIPQAPDLLVRRRFLRLRRSIPEPKWGEIPGGGELPLSEQDEGMA